VADEVVQHRAAAHPAAVASDIVPSDISGAAKCIGYEARNRGAASGIKQTQQ